MTASANKLKDPDFGLVCKGLRDTGGGESLARSPRAASHGKKQNARRSSRAGGWTFSSSGKSITRQSGDATDDAPSGVTIECDDADGRAVFSQIVVCKPGEHYRVDATVSCALHAADQDAGCILTVEPLIDDQPAGDMRATHGIHQSTTPIAIRTYYQAPRDVRRLRITVGIHRARGFLQIHHARVYQILEPEANAHPFAVPPPPWSLEAPHAVKRVCVCSTSAASRPITGILTQHFGSDNIVALAPDELRPTTASGDALILPDATPPKAIRSLASLVKLARGRTVIISLPAFAKLTRGHLSLRRVEQVDDPIHAKVIHTDYATRGFAIADVFPYAWEGKATGSQVQHQLRSTPAQRSFCDRHDLQTVLASVCDQDVTTDRPICLRKLTPGGALIVLDIDPAEEAASTFGEPDLAVHLLLSMLGEPVTGMGQYIVPHDTEAEFRSAIRELAYQFPHFRVHDADLPADEVTEQIVTIGGDDEMFGLPVRPKPVIIVRSGLTQGDTDSVYGSLIWFKQLLRTTPDPCPYAEALASRFRFAWVPLVARWEVDRGFGVSGEPPEVPTTIELEGTTIAAMIDVVSYPGCSPRVIVPDTTGAYQPVIKWLPSLHEHFRSPSGLAHMADADSALGDTDAFSWRPWRPRIDVTVDASAFTDDVYRDLFAGGGHAIRIETPGGGADGSAMSIHYTDLIATLLEQVIGLQFGLIAVNRRRPQSGRPSPIQFDGFPPVAPGEALIIDSSDPMLSASAAQAG